MMKIDLIFIGVDSACGIAVKCPFHHCLSTVCNGLRLC